MTNTAAIVANGVTFAKQRNGYDREQVDRYIDMLTQAYQTAYDEHTTVYAKYSKLLEECAGLKKQLEHNNTSASTLTKTLFDAEKMAEQIISEAHAEAEKIKGDACIEKIAAKRSLEVANEYISDTISKLQSLTEPQAI